MSELKPCPFCGFSPRIITGQNSPGRSLYQVKHNCPHLLSEIKTFCRETEEEATSDWNRRTQSSNEPLTLEQLRKMHGEPVWVVPNRGIAKWYLVDVANDACETCDMDVVDFELYGPENKSYGWLAYRHKPEGSENDG